MIARLTIILLLVVILLSGCSKNFHCRKCAEVQPTKTDTVYRQFFVEVPSVKTDTVFKDIPGVPVTITKDKLVIHYRRMPGDTVYIDGECKPDSIIVKVPTLVTNEIKTGLSKLYVIGAVISTAVIALILGLFIGKLMK